MYKKILSVVFACLFFCMSVTIVSADVYEFNDDNFSAEISSDYTVITKTNIISNSDVIKKIGHTEESVSAFMKNNHVYLIAVGNGNRQQVQISCYESDFSKKAKSLSNLNKEDIASIGNALFNSDFTAESINDLQYICNKSESSLQYIAFEHGKTYQITLYGFSDSEALEFMKNIKIERTQSGTKVTAYIIIISVLVAAVLIGLIVAIVLLSIKIFRQLKDKNPDDLANEEITIKRRKF